MDADLAWGLGELEPNYLLLGNFSQSERLIEGDALRKSSSILR